MTDAEKFILREMPTASFRDNEMWYIHTSEIARLLERFAAEQIERWRNAPDLAEPARRKGETDDTKP